MIASLELRAVASDDLAQAPETARMGRGPRAMRRAQTVKAKAWVARLTLKLGAISREFVRGKLDPHRSGGAYVVYLLKSGEVYEVSSPTGPFEAERYFCRVTDQGEIERLDRAAAVAILATGQA